jgi:signal transduction histidine kinase
MSPQSTDARGIKVTTKLQLSFLLVGFLSIGVTGWQAFENARSTIETMTFDRLTSIRETKRRQIEAYFQQIQNQAITLSEDRMIVEATERFTAAFRPVGKPQREKLLESLGPTPGQHKTALGEYRSVHSTYHPILESYRRRFGYDDIFLVDAASGDIVYSTLKKSDFASNLLTGPFRETTIASVFRKAKGATNADFTALADFAPYDASGSVPAAFIASPIFDGDRNVGVLVFQMSITLINRVMTSGNNWRAEGLGGTGETYIVGADYRMRTDSRFFIQEPEQYFRRLLEIGTDSSIVGQIRLQKTSILLQQVRTDATIDALAGHTDTKIINDYRGIPVLSSYTPLTIPGVQWVMLSEIDASKAFDSIVVLRERFILFGLVILFAAAALGVLISRTMSRPILSLAKSTERFGQGDLSHRASVTSNDEIGLLAATFNQMAENTMKNTLQLQKEIVERCHAEEELQRSQERLRNLSRHLQTVREDERKGMAREIHDELGQALTTLKLHLALLRDEIAPSDQPALEKITSITGLIDTTIKSVKRMITELRPRLLDDLGLPAAIEWQADDFQQRTGIRCDVSIEPEDLSLDPDRSTAIFRIFQETLTNIARHSGATRAHVALTEADGDIELHVRDNGTGISDEQLNNPKSFGIIGIRERASYWGGSVDIQGIRGSGTTVVVRLHVRQQGEAHD